MRLVLLSDSHGQHEGLAVPDGDVLVHAGDFCLYGSMTCVSDFAGFLDALPHRHKVVVAGNHDFALQVDPVRARKRLAHAHYLFDSAVEIDGLRFWGSPWQPEFMGAFNLPRGRDLERVWARIPDDTDVLVTHGPPQGVLDRTWDGRVVGCEHLRARVAEVRPRLHVFGHIHEARGECEMDGTRFVNASVCGPGLTIAHPPVVVDLD